MNKLYEESDVKAVGDQVRRLAQEDAEYTISEMCTKLATVNGEVPDSDEFNVSFIDYDGTLLYSFPMATVRSDDFVVPTPETEHDGIIFDGWNWTRLEMRQIYGPAVIGATYRPANDEDVLIHITLPDSDHLDMQINFYQLYSDGVAIDWGDDSAIVTYTDAGWVTPEHTYLEPGNYIIRLSVQSGVIQIGMLVNDNGLGWPAHDATTYSDDTYCLTTTDEYSNYISEINLSDNVILGVRPFHKNFSMELVTIQNNPKHNFKIDGTCYVTYNCSQWWFLNQYGLKALVIPRNFADYRWANTSYFLARCCSLENLSCPAGYYLSMSNIEGATGSHAFTFTKLSCNPYNGTSSNDSKFTDNYLKTIYYDSNTTQVIKAISSNCKDIYFTRCYSVPSYDATSATPGAANVNVHVNNDTKALFLADSNWKNFNIVGEDVPKYTKYYRFNIYSIRNTYYIRIGKIFLYDQNDEIVNDLYNNISITLNTGRASSSSYPLANIFNQYRGRNCEFRGESVKSSTPPFVVTAAYSMNCDEKFKGCSFLSSIADSDADPMEFSVDYSEDGETWTEILPRTEIGLPTDRWVESDKFIFNYGEES